MFDYFRIACAVPSVEVADVDFNVGRIEKFILTAKNKGVDLLVFPELCVTGRSCADLFFQRSASRSALAGIRALISASADAAETVFAAGVPLRLGDAACDCAVVIARGKAVGIVPKLFSSDYGEIGGRRRFFPGYDLKINSISSGSLGISGEDYGIPVGRLVFDVGGVKIGFEIGDDSLSPVPPSVPLCLAGAKVVANPTAVPETRRDVQRVRSNALRLSESLRCAYALCSAGASESTTDFVFSGYGLVCENGIPLAEQKKTAADDYMLVADADLGKLERLGTTAERFADCAALLVPEEPRLIKINVGPSISSGEYAKTERFPFVPSDEKEKREKCLSIFETQVAGLKKRLKKTGARPVIGISGGLDSALALLVCVRAIKDLGKPSSEVTGVTMPCFGTSEATRRNALGLIRSLGVTGVEIPIEESCLLHFRDIGQDPGLFDATYENSQARERTQVLMDLAGRTGGLVVGTGDLSEAALGWCTYNGDHSSMYAVNSGVPKTLIPHMIGFLKENPLFSICAEYLENVVKTPISPELLPPGANGKTVQKTEDAVGSFALNDFFLYNVMEFGFGPEKIFFLARKAFKDEFDGVAVLNGLKNFYLRFFRNQFKRSCSPDGVRVCEVSLSPRGRWSMPSDASAAVWLRELEKIKT